MAQSYYQSDSGGGWYDPDHPPWETYDPTLNPQPSDGSTTGNNNPTIGGWNWGSTTPTYTAPTYGDYYGNSSWTDNIGNNFANMQNSGLLSGIMGGHIWNPAQTGATAQANNGANWWMLNGGAGTSPYANRNVAQSNYEINPYYWQDMLASNGKPVDQTEAWNAARDVANNALQDAFRQAAEGFSAGHTRFSSGSATQMGESARKAGADLAAQRLQMELTAQENARARMMQAMGYDLQGQQSEMQQAMSNANMSNTWNQALLSADMQARLQALGLLSNNEQFNAGQVNQNNQFNANQANNWYQNLINQDASTRLQAGQLGANYALGLSSQQQANAQDQYNNYMALINAMNGYGSNMQTTSQNALNNIYQSTMAYLPYALQLANSFPPGGITQPSQGKGSQLLGGIGDIMKYAFMG